MKTKSIIVLVMVLAVISLVWLGGCAKQEKNTGIANPASVYCENNSGNLEIRTAADGGQTGYCKFSNGKECEEWAFYKGECSSQNTGTETSKPSSPANIELSIPDINSLNEVSELNIEMLIKETSNITYPVIIELRFPSTIEYVGETFGFNNNTNSYVVWEGQLADNELKNLKFNIKPVAEGEYQQIMGCMNVKADKVLIEQYPDEYPSRNIFGDCDAIYITSKDGKITVLSEEDMSKIVAERIRSEAVPLDQLQHRENMTEPKGPATR